MSRTRLLNSTYNIRSWFRNNIIKRPEYFIYYCAIPVDNTVEVVNSTEVSNGSSLQLFQDFTFNTLQGTAIDATALGLFVIGSCAFAGCKVQEMSSRNRLITRGFFKYSRNPMAISCMLSLIGGCMLTHNIWFTLFLPTFGWGVLNFYAIPIEEKELLKKFGKQYEDYMNCTKRWLTLSSNKST
eukprot:142414_1